VTEFNLQVGIDPRGARRGAAQVNDALRTIDGQGRRTGTAITRVERGIGRLGREAAIAGGALRALFAGVAVQQATRLADQFTTFNNSIRLVTDSALEFNVIQNELIGIAERVRAPIAEIGSLYGRAALSADALGASQQELLVFTEAVGNALRIAGSSTAQAQGALLQLGQALGSGIVRAEEFNSVLEGARPVLTAVADGLGVTIAELRNLVLEGEITSREFFDALISQSEELEETAGRAAPTIASSFTDLNNALTVTVGRFSESTGAGAGFASVIDGLATFVRGPLLQGLVDLSLTLQQLGADFQNLFNFIGQAGEQLASFLNLGGAGFGAFGDAVQENLLNPFDSLRTFLEILTIEVSNAFTVIGTQLGGIAAAIQRVLSFDLEGAALIERQTTADVEALRAGRRGAIEDALAGSTARRSQSRAAFEEVSFSGASALSQADIAAVLSQAPGGGAVSAPQIIEDTADAERELQRLLRRGESIRESVRTEQEVYNETLLELGELLNAGAIDVETFNRASTDALEALQGTNEQFDFLRDAGRAAAEDIQGAFTDLFLSAGDGLEGFADQFGQTLQRLAANFLANQAIQFLVGQFGGGGGPLGAFLSGFGGLATGGSLGVGEAAVVGERGPEIVRGPGTVNSTAATAAAPPGGMPAINIVNVTDPREATNALDTATGDRAVLNSVSRNRAAIKRELGLA
jgi:tape measure domain-containing protein